MAKDSGNTVLLRSLPKKKKSKKGTPSATELCTIMTHFRNETSDKSSPENIAVNLNSKLTKEMNRKSNSQHFKNSYPTAGESLVNEIAENKLQDIELINVENNQDKSSKKKKKRKDAEIDCKGLLEKEAVDIKPKKHKHAKSSEFLSEDSGPKLKRKKHSTDSASHSEGTTGLLVTTFIYATWIICVFVFPTYRYMYIKYVF